MTSDPDAVETAQYILRHYAEAHGDIPAGTWLERLEPVAEALRELADDLDETDYQRERLAHGLAKLIALRTEPSALEVERDRYAKLLDAIAQAVLAARAPFRKEDHANEV